LLQKASERYLRDRKQSAKDQKRILEVLSKGLSAEFPNPNRVGCPGSTTLEGIASHQISLAEVEKWLDHLGSCSPCFEEFTAIQKKLRTHRRFRLGGGLAIIFALLALWFAFRSKHPVARNDVAVLDLRSRSIERGEQGLPNQPSLYIRRTVRHVTLYLPVGSKEGAYDLALLNKAGNELLHTITVAQLENHVVVLRADIDFGGVPPGSYFLGLRQPGLRWTQFPVHVV
jgi:hypothetical protein